MLTIDQRAKLIVAIEKAVKPPMGQPGDFIRLDEQSWDEIVRLLRERQAVAANEQWEFTK